jgi:hypothetical protein
LQPMLAFVMIVKNNTTYDCFSQKMYHSNKLYLQPMVLYKENDYLGINSKVLQIHLED